MDIDLFRQFVALSGCKSFKKAAETLHVSQPTLSRNIAALESHFGQRLVSRDHPIALTTAGRMFLERSGEILYAYDKLNRDMAVMRNSQKGEVAIQNADFIVAVGDLIDIAIGILRTTHPLVKITPKRAFGNALAALESGELDVIFDYSFCDGQFSSVSTVQACPSAYEVCPLVSQEGGIVALAHADNPLTRQSNCHSMEKLLSQKLMRVSNSSHNAWYESFENMAKHRHGIDVNWSFADVRNLRDMLLNLNDDRIVFLSRETVERGVSERFLSSNLVLIEPEYAPSYTISAVYRSDTENKATPLLIDALREASSSDWVR